MDDILQAEQLSKWYGSIMALNDVVVELQPGITGVLGPNGSGKSTFFKILLGQVRPSLGHVRVLGMKPWDNPRLNQRLGFCLESDVLYEYFSGYEFLRDMLGIKGFAPRTARRLAREALERVRLEAQAHSKIRTYSRGMRQRLKFAFALAHRPDLVVLDEPFTGIDPQVKHDLVALVRILVQEGKSFLISSHVLSEIEMLTPTILLLYQGRVLAYGDVHEIRSLMDRHPHSVWVKTAQHRELASLLAREKEVLSIQLDDVHQTLLVRTGQPQTFYALLGNLVLQRQFVLEELTSPDDTLQAVFDYLTKK